MKKMQAQQGFTIIELVVVILLLGILTATALPRFMDVTDQAHESVVSGVEGGLATGIALAHAQWFGENRPSLLSGFGDGTVNVGDSGYPIGSDGAFNNAADCIAVFADVLQGGRPTTAEASGGDLSSGALDGGDYTADFAVGISGTGSIVQCVYAYTAQGTVFSAPYILYSPISGTVARSLTPLPPQI
jgi:MSHA pilin protein MshB